MIDLSTALGRVKNALASNLGADSVLVLAKVDVAELLALIEKRAPLDYGSLDAVQRLAVCRGEPKSVAVAPEPTYRLLGDGDIIQDGDETLSEDTATWGQQPMGVFRGMPYNRRVMLPVRRATSR